MILAYSFNLTFDLQLERVARSRQPSTTLLFDTIISTNFIMAFILRQPFTISTALRQLPKASTTASKAFHTAPFKFARLSKPSPLNNSLTKSRDALKSNFRRTYMQQPYDVPRPDTSNLSQKLLYGAAILGGTIIATNLLFNRETREDGGMPPFERAYLNDTFLHTGLGIGIIGVAAQALHRSGWSYRLMLTNPWIVVGGSLVAGIGTMYACFVTDPDK
jgi:hypothetical protein